MQSALTILFQKNYTLPCMGTAVILHEHQTLQVLQVLKYLGKKSMNCFYFYFLFIFIGRTLSFWNWWGFLYNYAEIWIYYMWTWNQIIWHTWGYKHMKCNKLDCYQMILTGSLVFLVTENEKTVMSLVHKEKWERSWICLLQTSWN